MFGAHTYPQVIRGQMPMTMQCAPAFNYARSKHTMEIIEDDSSPYAFVSSRFRHMKAMFKSEDGMNLDLRYVVESTMEAVNPPVIRLESLDLTTKGHKGLAASADLNLDAGQCVTFVLRSPPSEYPAFFYSQTPMVLLISSPYSAEYSPKTVAKPRPVTLPTHQSCERRQDPDRRRRY